MLELESEVCCPDQVALLLCIVNPHPRRAESESRSWVFVGLGFWD